MGVGRAAAGAEVGRAGFFGTSAVRVLHDGGSGGPGVAALVCCSARRCCRAVRSMRGISVFLGLGGCGLPHPNCTVGPPALRFGRVMRTALAAQATQASRMAGRK